MLHNPIAPGDTNFLEISNMACCLTLDLCRRPFVRNPHDNLWPCLHMTSTPSWSAPRIGLPETTTHENLPRIWELFGLLDLTHIKAARTSFLPPLTLRTRPWNLFMLTDITRYELHASFSGAVALVVLTTTRLIFQTSCAATVFEGPSLFPLSTSDWTAIWESMWPLPSSFLL